jgi:hypothetical protein
LHFYKRTPSYHYLLIPIITTNQILNKYLKKRWGKKHQSQIRKPNFLLHLEFLFSLKWTQIVFQALQIERRSNWKSEPHIKFLSEHVNEILVFKDDCKKNSIPNKQTYFSLAFRVSFFTKRITNSLSSITNQEEEQLEVWTSKMQILVFKTCKLPLRTNAWSYRPILME